jgi:hypothetical protein
VFCEAILVLNLTELRIRPERHPADAYLELQAPSCCFVVRHRSSLRARVRVLILSGGFVVRAGVERMAYTRKWSMLADAVKLVMASGLSRPESKHDICAALVDRTIPLNPTLPADFVYPIGRLSLSS